MLVAEGRKIRRIVGRLDQGDELLASLLSLCRERNVRAGEIRAFGSLETLEICQYDAASKTNRPTRRFACAFDILGFMGNVSEQDGAVSIHAHITVSRERDNGIEVLGGHVASARVFACEFVIEAWDDVLLRRGFDAGTGLPLWQEAFQEAVATAAPAPAPTPATTSATTPATATSTTTSTNKPTFKEEPELVVPEIGDTIDHPTFGRAQVERMEGHGEFLHVRLKSGRLIRLSLDVLDLHAAGQDGGRRILQANIRR